MEHYHFIGIGGIGMSSLATILLERGHEVSGSDLCLNERTSFLANRGALIYEGHDAKWVKEGATVVYHARIHKDHPEFQNDNRKVHRLDLLKETMGEVPIYAVVGAHGKTSTSALLSHVLTHFDQAFGFSVGGVLVNTLQNGKDGSRGFALEGDESDGSFLRIHPNGAILTNVEPDHLDFWGDFSSLKRAYQEFIEQIIDPTLFFYAIEEDCQLASCGISYGIDKGDIQAQNCVVQENGTHFTIVDQLRKERVKKTFIPLFGLHQVKNALGVYGLCRRLGVPIETILEAFSTYKGVKRRCEFKGTLNGAPVFSDYGHHPTELKATFEGLSLHQKKRLTVVFEPHKFTRTKSFFAAFVDVLSSVDELILLDTYAATEEYDFEGSSEKLALALGIQVTQEKDLKTVLKGRSQTILFIGAGNIDQICHTCLSSND